MEIKKLGIVIPTFNRSIWLKKALEALMPQVEKKREEVCVYITDNASMDDTESVVSFFMKKYSGMIDYYKQKHNNGYFENFNYGIKNIPAEYIFLHGDDDVVTPYFVDFILNVIRKNDGIAWIHFNYFLFDVKKKYTTIFKNELDTSIPIIQYTDSLQMMKDFMNAPSFMSSNIFRKEGWVENVGRIEKKECYGYEWTYVMLKSVIGKPSLYIKTPIFVQQFSGTNNYNSLWPLYSLVGIYKVFELLDTKLLEKWRTYHQKYLKKEFYRSISLLYMDKHLYKEKYDEIVQYMGGADRFLASLIVFVFPSSFSKFLISLPVRCYFKLLQIFQNIMNYV